MHYRKNFLTKVIFKIDFGSFIKKTQDDSLVSGFSSGLKENYPIIRPKPITQVSVKVSPSGSGMEQGIIGKVWEHYNKEQNKILILSPDFLLLEYQSGVYSHFADFKNDMVVIYEKFQSVFDITSFGRIGLRYINEIRIPEGNPLNWDRLIKDSLLKSTLAGLSPEMKLTRSMHQFMANYGDDISLLFQYGIFNPEHPNPVSRREFILDIDCYVSAPIEKGEVIEKLVELNEVAEKTFENSIDDDLRRMMEVIND
jgi:uncharacterized protein (TIGR04255 family)